MTPDLFPRQIEFHGPFPLCPEDPARWPIGEKATCPGLYLFTIPVNGGNRILYIGEAKNIADRLREHLTCYLSGKYLLYDSSSLVNGHLVPVWCPSPETERTIAALQDHRHKLAAMLHLVNIFFAEVHAEKHILHRMESALIKSLRESNEAGAFLENTRLSVSRHDELLPVEVLCTAPLFAVPQQIFA